MEANALQTFITNVGTVLAGVVDWFASVSSALIANEIFQVILAVVIFITMVILLVNLVGKIRTRQRTR